MKNIVLTLSIQSRTLVLLLILLIIGCSSPSNAKLEFQNTIEDNLSNECAFELTSYSRAYLDVSKRKKVYLINTSEHDIILFTVKVAFDGGRASKVIKLFPGDETLLGLGTIADSNGKIHDINYQIVGEVIDNNDKRNK